MKVETTKPTPSTRRCSEVLAELLDARIAELSRAVRASNREALHDLRVALRKLLATLLGYSDHLRVSKAAELTKMLKAANRMAGRARNVDVQLEIVDKWLRRAKPPVKGNAARKLRQILGLKLRKERAKLKAPLRTQIDQVISALRAEVQALRKPLWSPLLPQALDQALERLEVRFTPALREASRKRTSKRLHRLRIAAKNLRYILQPHLKLNTETKDAYVQLKSIQTVLGDLRDLDRLHKNLGSVEFKPIAKLAGYKNFKRDIRHARSSQVELLEQRYMRKDFIKQTSELLKKIKAPQI